MSLSNFEIGKVLGKGSFSSVVLVKRKEDGITYAMKRVKISQLSTKERENALNEIRILASLQHKNIIGYKEAFFDEESKTLNIVMEFADDGDIEGKISHNKKFHMIFEEKTIWLWIIQILEGLKYLHENNIMHRDLKCANLFLMKNGLLKLGDLNVSKIAKMGIAQTQTGTPYYASPEIWKDQPYDYKSDIWSVGCIIYEICKLRPPFTGTSLRNLYENISKGVYEPIPSIYSRDMSKFIGMMLVVDPTKRLSATSLLESEIIKRKMKDYKGGIIEEILESAKTDGVDLIKTIKLPRHLKDINKELPKKRYAKKRQEEMMMNDEYETKKADFFKKILEEEKKNSEFNNIIVKDIKRRPISSVGEGNNIRLHTENKPEEKIKEIHYKYHYMNINKDNNIDIPKHNYNYDDCIKKDVISDFVRREKEKQMNNDDSFDILNKPIQIRRKNNPALLNFPKPKNIYINNRELLKPSTNNNNVTKFALPYKSPYEIKPISGRKYIPSSRPISAVNLYNNNYSNRALYQLYNLPKPNQPLLNYQVQKKKVIYEKVNYHQKMKQYIGENYRIKRDNLYVNNAIGIRNYPKIMLHNKNYNK